jgi:hypothetical protein
MAFAWLVTIAIASIIHFLPAASLVGLLGD